MRIVKQSVKLRTAPAAHPQMREVAYMVADILLAHVRVCFEDVIGPER